VHSLHVMPGLVPGIHVFAASREDVDGRDEPGHDDVEIPRALTPLIRLLAERAPERMAGIDPDDAEFAREEFQLLQR
jgi:hypothetical protein